LSVTIAVAKSTVDVIHGAVILKPARSGWSSEGGSKDSIVTLTLEDVDGGTLVTLVHSNVPEKSQKTQRAIFRQRTKQATSADQ
jgi:Activator of Hsp90 ATPase homolog 1-like protein